MMIDLSLRQLIVEFSDLYTAVLVIEFFQFPYRIVYGWIRFVWRKYI